MNATASCETRGRISFWCLAACLLCWVVALQLSFPHPASADVAIPTTPNGYFAAFTGVSGSSGSDVWAAGYVTNNSNGHNFPLFEHWDGASWQAVSSPALENSNPNAVVAISPSDAWAVGADGTDLVTTKPLAEHWDGVSWAVAPVPTSVQSGYLTAAAAVSANDVFAVGIGDSGALIEHWDGTTWSVMPTPSSVTQDILYGVVADSSSDVYAVGYSFDPVTGTFRPLAEHWDGDSWTIQSTPTLSSSGAFQGVTASSSTDIIAVGLTFDPITGAAQPLVERSDGQSWSVIPTPTLQSGGGFTGAGSLSATDSWAVGFGSDRPGKGRSLAEHWDGSAWSRVASPSPGSAGASFTAIDALASTDVWAVGIYGTSNNGIFFFRTLAEHWDGQIWSVVVTPNPPPP
jgi:hypothetical protein